MITVNGNEHPWHKGLTVEQVLREKNYIFPMIIVKINDTFVPEDKYGATPVDDGDDFWAIHLIAGG
ncbi:MAG: sulfur carrier protein ThiS [Candidatus Edwardsbacteria bacterium]|nr:sulfur carrier protein ThiS [Candidatus Edwardsbacteria bacterium]